MYGLCPSDPGLRDGPELHTLERYGLLERLRCRRRLIIDSDVFFKQKFIKIVLVELILNFSSDRIDGILLLWPRTKPR